MNDHSVPDISGPCGGEAASLPPPRFQAWEELSDAECVQRTLAGDAGAFELLVSRYEARVYAFALRRMGSRPDAEDLALKTFDKVYRNLHRYSDRYAFSTWLFTILRREAASFWRRRPPAEPLEDHAPSPRRPDEELESADTLQELWSIARGALSADQFAAVWLAYGEQCSTPEVARELWKSPTATRVLLHRARKRLVTALTEQGILPSTLSSSIQTRKVSHVI